MTQSYHDRLAVQIKAVRPLAEEYPGQTIDSILRQLEARAREVKPHAQPSITINPNGSLRFTSHHEDNL